MLKKITQTVVRWTPAMVCAALTTVASAADDLVNNGSIDPATWVRGPLYNAPTNHPVWNPVKQKRLAGQEFWLATVGDFSLPGYCTIAAQGDGTFTEMQHSEMDWSQVWAMWSQPCAYSPLNGPKPGSRLSGPLKRDIQKALDGGAMELVIPTMDSVEEAYDLIDMIYYPPIGHRKYGPSQAEKMYANVPGGYRATFNDNVVVIFMMETILSSKNANDIASVPYFDGIFGATSDLGNFSSFANPNVDYEKLIRNAYDAAKSHGKVACSSAAFRARNYPTPPFNFTYSFDCYQGNRPANP